MLGPRIAVESSPAGGTRAPASSPAYTPPSRRRELVARWPLLLMGVPLVLICLPFRPGMSLGEGVRPEVFGTSEKAVFVATVGLISVCTFVFCAVACFTPRERGP